MKKKTVFALALGLLALPASAAETKPTISPIDPQSTALLITDPQNDFLHQKGGAYGLLKDNIKALNTIDNIGALLDSAERRGIGIFISPHGYSEQDKSWQHRGALQQTMHDIGLFKMSAGEGVDFLARYKPVINNGRTVISSPHKIYGPESNDLLLQLHKRGVKTVVLGGMAANLCTDSHLRALVEQGFKVIVVKDAVAAPGEAAYAAALTNYGLIAHHVVDTQTAVGLLSESKR